jgi:hypothetical protein
MLCTNSRRGYGSVLPARLVGAPHLRQKLLPPRSGLPH